MLKIILEKIKSSVFSACSTRDKLSPLSQQVGDASTGRIQVLAGWLHSVVHAR